MKHIILATVGLFLLVGCNTAPKEIVVSKRATEMRIIAPVKPRAIRSAKVAIKVFDRDALELALQDPEFRRIIGMSEKDYGAISNNYSEAIRFIEAQTSIIEYYETVIKELRDRNIVEPE